MKEKEASNRKSSSPRKASKQLVMDVTLKTQMKKRADASREAVKGRHKEPKDGAKKKEVTFAETSLDQKDALEAQADEDDTQNQSLQEDTPRDLNTSGDSLKEDNNNNNNNNNHTTLEGDEAASRNDDETATGLDTAHDDIEKTGTSENKEEKEEGMKEEGMKEEEGEEGEEHNKDKEDDKEDKKGKKGKKKGGKNKSKKEVKKKVEKPKPVSILQGEVTAGTEEFRTFIFDKVQSALEIVCTDGVTDTTVDNVTPLLKSLDIDTSDEGVIDLMRDALVDNFGIINPLDLDQVVQKSQEANELTEMDDCLEVAFKLIDFDEDEFITQKDIYKLGLRLGEELAEFALDEMVDAVDMDKDGKISLRDFRYFLLGRDVPSRKEIFAMAEAARKKREDEEERKREEEEKKENERQAILYQKIKDGEIIEMEGDDEDRVISDKTSEEEGGEGSDLEKGKTDNENKEQTVENELEKESGEETVVEVKEAAPKTEAELLREKRKSVFAGYANAVAAVNILSKTTESSNTEASPKVDDDKGDNKDDNGGNDDNDADFDDEDESERDDFGPIPLHTSLNNLNLPPPDLSTVSHAIISPSSTPAATPRRPTIVGIGGLGLGELEGSSAFTEAIHRLEGDMIKGDNRVPERPHRRRSTCSSIDEALTIASAHDVEDYNNRLVFKLPPRRKSSCTPPIGVQRQSNDTERSSRQHRNPQSKCAMATDSDEGIDLADEEMVEPTLIEPCGALAPSVSLRISLPHGDELEGATGYDEDQMNVAIVTRKGRRRSSSSSASIRIDERGIATLGVGPYSDTPRSMSRSEFSVTHISLVSPRLTDDDDDDGGNDYKNNDDDDLETTTSKAAVRTASNTSGYDCDGDSVALSFRDDDQDSHEDLSRASEKLSHYKKGRLKKVKLKTGEGPDSEREVSPTPSLSRRKSMPKPLKRNLSCNKIEIKELALNEPVPVGQFSNRHKFGMIPRDVSKFIVLGKSPSTIDQSMTPNSALEEDENDEKDDDLGALPKKSPKVRWQELPDKIRPILKNKKQENRRIVFTPPVKEHNVLQGRRLSLLNDFDSPLLKNRQSFDLPLLPDKIQIPTGNDNSSSSASNTAATLDSIRKMEKKILKRSKTSFELPSVYEGHSDGAMDSCRSDASKSKRTPRSRPLSARRRSSPVASYDSDGSGRHSAREDQGRYSSRHRKISIVDLSKSLRRDTACKDTASLSKKHSGFKSIVPLARVVMAYQSSKKKQKENGGFYSISRQLEKSGVPFNSTSSSMSSLSPGRVASTDSRYKTTEKRRRCRSARGRSSGSFSYSKTEGEDSLYSTVYDEDIHTLVGDLKDPDALPAHIVFQKVRPATAHAGITSRSSNLNGSMSGSRSNIVTLEIPETNKFEKKLKNVSLLSKLPIR